VPERIFQEIHEHLLDQGRIHGNKRKVFRYHDFYLAVPEAAFSVGLKTLSATSSKGYISFCQLPLHQIPGVSSPADSAPGGKAVPLGLDIFQKLAGFGVLGEFSFFQESARGTDDRRKRRAEIMRDVKLKSELRSRSASASISAFLAFSMSQADRSSPCGRLLLPHATEWPDG